MTVPARLLRPASLEVGTGDLVALIGPSRSGKTTLLRALAGLGDVTDGEVLLAASPPGPSSLLRSLGPCRRAGGPTRSPAALPKRVRRARLGARRRL